MLMFSHGVSSGWLREVKRRGAQQQPGALAGSDPGIGKEDIGGRACTTHRFSAWRAISYPAGSAVKFSTLAARLSVNSPRA
jgi:hypothetical protein